MSDKFGVPITNFGKGGGSLKAKAVVPCVPESSRESDTGGESYPGSAGSPADEEETMDKQTVDKFDDCGFCRGENERYDPTPIPHWYSLYFGGEKDQFEYYHKPKPGWFGYGNAACHHVITPSTSAPQSTPAPASAETPADEAKCNICGNKFGVASSNLANVRMDLPYVGGNGKTRPYCISCVAKVTSEAVTAKPSTPAVADAPDMQKLHKRAEKWLHAHSFTNYWSMELAEEFVAVAKSLAAASTPPAVADALQLISAERERQVEPECKRCHQTMLIRDGEEPTEVCDHCAHEMLSAISDVVLHHRPKTRHSGLSQSEPERREK